MKKDKRGGGDAQLKNKVKKVTRKADREPKEEFATSLTVLMEENTNDNSQ
ncbi:MAG: hypothetical protein GX755_07850 [Syntrophomonadaceae bacterium]|nr:hypothetical protein [Syntrophomonadaceae bacterium]